jgi:hypothetical protein
MPLTKASRTASSRGAECVAVAASTPATALSPSDAACAGEAACSRSVIRETLEELYQRDPERLLTRVRLSVAVPELRARFLDAQTHGVELLAPLLARKRGTSTDELHLRVVGSALIAAVFVALDLWQKDGGKRDLLVLLDDATDALAEGLRELQLRARA